MIFNKILSNVYKIYPFMINYIYLAPGVKLSDIIEKSIIRGVIYIPENKLSCISYL